MREWTAFARRAAYGLYERSIAGGLPSDRVPKHVAVMLDGNRRWARRRGGASEVGHKAGADNILPLLGWCEEAGVEIVTLWLLSTDNIRNRSDDEMSALLKIICDVVSELAETGRWRVNPVGAADLLPDGVADCLRAARDRTADVAGMLVNVAVPYGGRREVADAVKSLLREASARGLSIDEAAETVTPEAITEHLYTKGQPDPDLVIRTSGEQRLGGFLMWQSTHSEFYFCEALWPDFRKVDFLRALRAYAARDRRLGR